MIRKQVGNKIEFIHDENEVTVEKLKAENEELRDKQAVMQKALDDLIFSSMGGGGI